MYAGGSPDGGERGRARAGAGREQAFRETSGPPWSAPCSADHAVS